MPNNSDCIIIWDFPTSKLSPEDTVFSFLTPSQEHELLEAGTVKELVTMSRIMDDVSSEARKLYIELIADIGLYVVPDGRTLREALQYESRTSLWWYHPAACRNSDSDPTYTSILSLLAIEQEATKRGAKRLHLVKPTRGLAECLRSAFSICVENGPNPTDWLDLAHGLLGRFKWMANKIRTQFVLNRSYKRTEKKMDVALQGFWDWSVFPIENTEDQLSDRYFVNLPKELRKRGKTVGYLCTYDPTSSSESKKRSDKEILAPLKQRSDVVLLESLLNFTDVVLAAADFRPLLKFLRILRLRSFVEVFMKNGLNFFPILRWTLVEGFVGTDLPQCSLLAKSVERVCSNDSPELLICFQEHFPYSRAMYTGLSGSSSKSWAIQHASYNQGKTFVALHPEKEFAPQADGQSVPHPDKICVMGENGERLFKSCGYSQNQILLTGSPRYDYILKPNYGKNTRQPNHKNSRPINALLATSLPARAEFQFVDATVAAIKSLGNEVNLRLRQHPLDKIENLPGYARIKSWFELSSNSLDEDLEWADLVLISQSTVGEEAFLLGKPVWQFRFPHPNQSALAEVTDVPRFYTVSALREAFIDFSTSTEKWQPTETDVNHVYRVLFQTCEKKPSTAIAEAICNRLEENQFCLYD